MLLLVADQLLVDDACASLDPLIVLDDHSVGVLLVLLDFIVDVDDEDDDCDVELFGNAEDDDDDDVDDDDEEENEAEEDVEDEEA